MTIYISGPMTGIEDSNLQAFDHAESQLTSKGYDVINPHKISEQVNLRFFEQGRVPEYEDYLKEDIIQMLAKADAVLVLHGWRNSKGAKLEIANAIECGLKLFFDISSVQ